MRAISTFSAKQPVLLKLLDAGAVASETTLSMPEFLSACLHAQPCGQPAAGRQIINTLMEFVQVASLQVAASSLECTLKELCHWIHAEAVLPVDHALVVGAMSTWEQVPQLASLVAVKAEEGHYQVGFC